MTNERDELARLRRGVALVLAAIGLIAAVAAVLGFPLLFIVGRGPSNVGRFAGIFRSEFAAWLDHDGWRLSERPGSTPPSLSQHSRAPRLSPA